MAQPVFTGIGRQDSFEDFLLQFRQVAAINKWQERDLALILGAYLEGPALIFFKCIYKDDLSFQEICDCMKKEFPTRIDFAEKFYNARQSIQEDVMNFFYRLSNYAQKANITDESIFIKRFLKGVTNNYKYKLGTNLYSSKEELRATLLQVKDIFEGEQDEYMDVPIQPPRVHIETRPVNNQRLCDGETFHALRYNSSPRHSYENKTNRFNVFPRIRSPLTADHPEQTRTLTLKKNEELHAVSMNKQLHKENNKHGDLTPFINICIANQTYNALVDTGASISCIAEELVEQLGLEHTSDETKHFVRSITGSCLSVKGKARINFIVDSCIFSNDFVVIEGINQSLILGQDFLYKNEAIIDFSKQSVILKGRFSAKFCKNSEQNVTSISQPMVCGSCPDGSNKNNNVTYGQKAIEERSVDSISKNDYLYFSKLVDDNDENFLACTVKENNVNRELDINPNLGLGEIESLKNLLSSYRENFAFLPSELGSCSIEEISIRTVDEIPVHHPPYRVSPKQLDIINTQVEDMLKNGVIRESRSAYASPVVLVQKPDKTWRFCVDYRKLNKKVITDSYPLPIIEDLMIYLSGARYFADLDLNSGYWQHRLCEKDKHKTAFITAAGLYEFNVLPFGLKTSQAVFQRVMDKVLAGIKYRKAICYVDNILVWGNNFTEFIESLEEVMSRLKKANLTLKPNKCSFGYEKISVLGHEISGEGVRPDKRKLQSLKTLKAPINAKQVKSVLGLFSYYRKFISNFADQLRVRRCFVRTCLSQSIPASVLFTFGAGVPANSKNGGR